MFAGKKLGSLCLVSPLVVSSVLGDFLKYRLFCFRVQKQLSGAKLGCVKYCTKHIVTYDSYNKQCKSTHLVNVVFIEVWDCSSTEEG